MIDVHLSKENEATAIFEQLARERGVSVEKCVTLLVRGDLQRNTKNNALPLTQDVARFRLGESDS